MHSGVDEQPCRIPSEITAQRSFTASICCVNHHSVVLNQSAATWWVDIYHPHPIKLYHTKEFLLSSDFQLTILICLPWKVKNDSAVFVRFFCLFYNLCAGLQQIQLFKFSQNSGNINPIVTEIFYPRNKITYYTY